MTVGRATVRITLVRDDGTTTCCDAYSTIFIDDGVEYCKGCGNDVDGYTVTSPWSRLLTTK